MFRLFKIIFLLTLINLQITHGLKCEFPEKNYLSFNQGNDDRQFCRITDESSDIAQDFKPENVQYVEYKGEAQSLIDFTSSEFPVCATFSSVRYFIINHVKSVDKDLLKKCQSLTKAVISSTNMEEVPEDLFSDNPSLLSVEMERNKFTTLPEKIFANKESLRFIDLDYNQITSLPSNIFKSIPELEIISLNYNKIQTLHPDLFAGVTTLTSISLSNNQISDLPKNMFSSLEDLEILNLRNNKLTVIHSDSFGVLKTLTDVNLGDNQINAIDEKFFDNTGIETNFMIEFENNKCIGRTVFNKGQNMRPEFKTCFENYRPRAA